MAQMRGDWSYHVSGYYADDVELPKRPGDLACEIGCANAGVAALEVSTFRRRADIGEIVCVPPLPGDVVYP